MTDINPGQLVETINWKADRDLKNLDNTGTGFVIQPGTIIIWPGTIVPDGYLLCDGSEISRITYSALFEVIGTTYGPGDSSGTFNLPNFAARYPKGPSNSNPVGRYGQQTLPNITGSISNDAWPQPMQATGAFYRSFLSATYRSSSIGAGNAEGLQNFDASKSNSIYGNTSEGTEVNPFSITVNFCIKY